MKYACLEVYKIFKKKRKNLTSTIKQITIQNNKENKYKIQKLIINLKFFRKNKKSAERTIFRPYFRRFINLIG
jgi:hypothetical protein